jgi:hypothetical protein
MDHERRAAFTEFRVAGRRLEGYAATFGTEARIADFTETIAPGAFAASLAERRDILALADHDVSRVLGRTKSGTLVLAEDTRGLAFKIELPDTQVGRDMLTLAERGDLGGASFGFRVRPDGERWTGNNRELRAVDLLEISVVSAWPAYPETVVVARSRQQPRLSLALARRYLELIG